VKDLHRLTQIIRNENPGLPVFLLGHSMGSVLAQLYASRYGELLTGLLYSGTTGPVEAGRLDCLEKTARREEEALGREAVSTEAAAALTGHFNDGFQPVKTEYDYMTRDPQMIADAIRSPYTHIRYKIGFYVDFIHALSEVKLESNRENIPKNLPIFSVSGSKDPFGENGEGVERLFRIYRIHGIADATCKIYKDGRHEMLREINRKEVFQDIIAWLEQHL
jgi:alpha-beta hydrolase superfamily lysophospholipase